MSLDDVGRNAAQDVVAKADSVETPEFATIQQHRRVRARWAAVTSLTAAAVLFVGVALFVRSPEGTTPFVSDSVPAPTTITLVPNGEDQEAVQDEIDAIESEIDDLEQVRQTVEEQIRQGSTSVTLARGDGNADPSGRDPLEVPFVFDLPEPRGVWARVDDPNGVFAVETFSESRETKDGGTISSSSGVRLTGVAEGPGGLVAVGSVTRGLSSIGAIWRSTDGIEWQRMAHNPEVFGSLAEGTNVAVRAVASDADGYVAVGTSGDSAVAWTSLDGMTWDVHVLQATDGDIMWPTGLERVESGWIATGSETDRTRPPEGNQVVSTVVHSQGGIWWSLDGRDWQRVESDSLVSATSNLHVQDVLQTEAGLYAVGTEAWDPVSKSDGAIWFSDDGLAWNRVEVSDAFGPGETGIVGIAERDGLLVAIGSSRNAARIWHSTDGDSWTVAHEEIPTGEETWIVAQAVVATDTGFVAVGVSIARQEDGSSPIYRIVSWQSTDGIAWSLVESAQDRANGFVWDITESNNKLTAVGDLNAIPIEFDNETSMQVGANVGAVWTAPTP